MYTPIIKQDFYQFYMANMTIDGIRIDVASSEWNQVAAIVDTGTPDVNIPVNAFAAMKSYLLSQCHVKKWPGMKFCLVLKTMI
jgi:hypothetical protein